MNFVSVSLVFVGGGLGSVTRFMLTKLTQHLWGAYPYGTLAANLLGALLIGALSVLIYEKQVIPTPYNDLALAGFLGGLTTFSSMVLDTYSLAEREPLWVPAAYLFSNLAVGFLLFFIAQSLARRA